MDCHPESTAAIAWRADQIFRIRFPLATTAASSAFCKQCLEVSGAGAVFVQCEYPRIFSGREYGGRARPFARQCARNATHGSDSNCPSWRVDTTDPVTWSSEMGRRDRVFASCGRPIWGGSLGRFNVYVLGEWPATRSGFPGPPAFGLRHRMEIHIAPAMSSDGRFIAFHPAMANNLGRAWHFLYVTSVQTRTSGRILQLV